MFPRFPFSLYLTLAHDPKCTSHHICTSSAGKTTQHDARTPCKSCCKSMPPERCEKSAKVAPSLHSLPTDLSIGRKDVAVPRLWQVSVAARKWHTQSTQQRPTFECWENLRRRSVKAHRVCNKHTLPP
uniref:Uncharacterized protein n=1 Tax=Lygus hesperus TaxID=30085 RepID=A0A146KNZ6_LYGHE